MSGVVEDGSCLSYYKLYVLCIERMQSVYWGYRWSGVRPGNPTLCVSRPLVTPYYCRLGDLLCFVFMSAYCMFDLSVYNLFLQYFDTVGWVF